MLKNYPMKFNTTEIPYPSTLSESYNVIEHPFTSEAGTDLLHVTRYNKLSVSMTHKCKSDLVATLEGFRDLDYFTFTHYNQITQAYETRTVRMRGYSKSYVYKSDGLSVTKGLWSVSFTLEEF